VRKVRPAIRIRELGLRPAQYILFLGRFSPEKNCHLLIDAHKQIDTTAKLVLAGGGPGSDPYVQQLRKHASDRIILLDYVSGDTFEELVTNTMIFVLPSDLEGLSLALLEAMGAGRCVLVSDIPENRELMENAGFTFRPGDTEDLKKMLSLLIRAEFLREAAGELPGSAYKKRTCGRALQAKLSRSICNSWGGRQIKLQRPTRLRRTGASLPRAPAKTRSAQKTRATANSSRSGIKAVGLLSYSAVLHFNYNQHVRWTRQL